MPEQDVSPEGEAFMEVEEGTADRKRRADPNEAIDLEEEEGEKSAPSQPIAIPVTPPQVQLPVNLEQLLLQSMQENRASFRDLRRDNEHLRHEVKEARRIADKALTTTEATQKKILTIEKARKSTSPIF